MNSTNYPQTLKRPKPVLGPSNHLLPLPPSNKIKPIFQNKVEWRCMIPSDMAYINKYKPKMISTVDLKSLRFQQINGARSLCKALIDTKRISCLIIKPDYSCDEFTKIGYILRVTNRWKKVTLKYTSNLDGEDMDFNRGKFKALIRFRRCTNLSSLNISFNCTSQIENKLLKYISPQIKWLPKLKALAIDIRDCSSYQDSDADEDENDNQDQDNDPNFPILEFKYPRSLSFLRLNFHEEGSINTQLLSIFAANIQRCRSLNHIDLDLQRLDYHIEPPEAQIWTSLAQKTSSLKTLKIRKTLHSYQFEENKAYLESFQHLKTLENLDINFYFSLSQENNQILSPIFFTHLASFINLKSLDATFSCHKDHPQFQNFFPCKTFAQLQQLRLNFTNCLNLENQFLQDFALTMSSLQKLKTFEIRFPSSEVTGEGIIAFSTGFKQLPQLKNLTLNFTNMIIDHKTIEIVSNNIAHLNLTFLNISVGWQPQKPKKSFFEKLFDSQEFGGRLTAFFSALYCFHSLENLTLDLMGFSICTKEWKHFALVIKELKQIKSLSLHMSRFDSANNYEGLRIFLSSLKELKKLHSLSLSFFETQLCNKHIELLFSNIQGCSKNLEKLELFFAQGERFGNEALQYIGSGLENFQALKHLSVVIGKQKVFPQEVAVSFLRRLMVFKGFESLYLSFKFPDIAPEMRTILMNIRKHQNFRKLKQFTFRDSVWA